MGIDRKDGKTERGEMYVFEYRLPKDRVTFSCTTCVLDVLF